MRRYLADPQFGMLALPAAFTHATGARIGVFRLTNRTDDSE